MCIGINILDVSDVSSSQGQYNAKLQLSMHRGVTVQIRHADICHANICSDNSALSRVGLG